MRPPMCSLGGRVTSEGVSRFQCGLTDAQVALKTPAAAILSKAVVQQYLNEKKMAPRRAGEQKKKSQLPQKKRRQNR